MDLLSNVNMQILPVVLPYCYEARKLDNQNPFHIDSKVILGLTVCLLKKKSVS